MKRSLPTIVLGHFSLLQPNSWLRKNIFLFAFPLFLVLSNSSVFSYSAFSFGLESGYAPNFLEMDRQFESIKAADERVVQKAVEVRDYYGNRVKISDIKSSGGQLVSIPMGFNFRYVYKRLFFKLGFLYHVIPPNTKSYVLNTRAGIDPALGDNNFYQDYQSNIDTDITNDVPQAFGIVPTNGKDWLFQSTLTAQVVEIPFTIGVVLIGKEYYKFYVGAGMTFFTGRSTRTISVKERAPDGTLNSFIGPNSAADVDQFKGDSVGFHFLIGSEFQVTKKIGLYGEFSFNIGAAVPLLDRVRTGQDTTNSLFHAAQITDQAGLDGPGSEVPGSVTKPGLPRLSGLSYRYFRFSLGISYNLMINKPTRVKLRGGLRKSEDKDKK